MKCPYCGGASRIVRRQHYPTYVKNYRKCLTRDDEFVTVEMYEDDIQSSDKIRYDSEDKSTREV